MEAEQQLTEWVVFGPAFWDADTLVARTSDGRWTYPCRGFNPEPGQYYYLRLEKRISKTTQCPYYVGYPRHGSVIEPPPEFLQLLAQLKSLESQVEELVSENAEFLEDMVGLQEKDKALREENVMLRHCFDTQERNESGENVPAITATPETIEKMQGESIPRCVSRIAPAS